MVLDFWSGKPTSKSVALCFPPSLFVNVNKSIKSQEELDSILKVPLEINEHQSYNAASHLVRRANVCAFRLHQAVKQNFTVCYKCLWGQELSSCWKRRLVLLLSPSVEVGHFCLL